MGAQPGTTEKKVKAKWDSDYERESRREAFQFSTLLAFSVFLCAYGYKHTDTHKRTHTHTHIRSAPKKFDYARE